MHGNFFLRGRGNCTHASLVLVQKTHINPISIVQNQGIIGAKYFITLGETAVTASGKAVKKFQI